MNNNKILCVIPARGGSKGIPHKNIKELNGKPLIYYSINVARKIFKDEDICISTDDDEIIKIVEKCGLKVPFKRPSELATDTATTNDVLLHALNFYESKNIFYDMIVLLQPTSPLRTVQHVKDAISLYHEGIDMVVSVEESSSNPYYNLFEEDEFGFLHISKGNGMFTRRQDAPMVWKYNGSIYIISCRSLKKCKISDFTRKVKFPMKDIYSVDIDSKIDWMIAENFLKNVVKST